jgi:hypothetical protein
MVPEWYLNAVVNKKFDAKMPFYKIILSCHLLSEGLIFVFFCMRYYSGRQLRVFRLLMQVSEHSTHPIFRAILALFKLFFQKLKKNIQISEWYLNV